MEQIKALLKGIPLIDCQAGYNRPNIIKVVFSRYYQDAIIRRLGDNVPEMYSGPYWNSMQFYYIVP